MSEVDLHPALSSTEPEGKSSLAGAVVLASAGRPELLKAVMADVEAQRDVEVAQVISVRDESSLPAQADTDPRWTVVFGTRGLAAQRNAGLDALDAVDVVFFFDDDAVVRDDYVANGLAFFARNPDVVGITGQVLLDGATHGEISLQDAEQALATSAAAPLTGRWMPTRELYGCNFASRRSAAPAVRFDGRLPLYSWLEDHDFARRLHRVGQLAKVEDCVIVHRGAASGGRQSHVRLGYSQVMNPVYLWRKKSFPAWLAASEIGKRFVKNVVLSAAGSQAPWRRQRLRGNLLATLDAVLGRITPERITTL